MNEADIKVKKQIVDKIKNSTNILIAVSQNPSVDDLAAAIGLAAVLNKLDKHATAIFSGTVPAAINFLEPDKVFENSVDSLRDFIISLDKEKADHLRYKVEGDVVKIFITPYRTTITNDDLEFSQGDFNVELVLALGVTTQEHLDGALSAHGQIIHDVTVATLTAGDQISSLGTLDWADPGASSLCEMVANMADGLKGEKDKTLLDKQISTALLTGIVAATERFSNTKTTSKVMTIAANLMAAGADQQLIAAKLQESHAITSLPGDSGDDINPDTTFDVNQDQSDTSEVQSTLPPDDGSLDISHGEEQVAEEVPIAPEPESTDSSTISTLPDEMPMSTLPDDNPPTIVDSIPAPQVEPTFDVSTIAPAYAVDEHPKETVAIGDEVTIEPLEPMLGGTLNATTDQAAEEARKQLEDQQNKMILQHSYLAGAPAPAIPVDPNPMSGVGQPESTANVDVFASNPTEPLASTIPDLPPPPPAPDFSTLPPPPLPDFSTVMSTSPTGERVIQPLPQSSDPSQFRIPGQ